MANDRSQKQPGSVDEGNRTGRGQAGRTGGKASKGGSMNEDRRSEDESEDIQARAGDDESGQGTTGNTRKSGGRVGQTTTGDQTEEDDQREGNQGGKR